MDQHTRSRRWIMCTSGSVHIPWTMKCGQWLVLSENYFDKMILSIRNIATQQETYITLTLRNPTIVLYISSLITPAEIGSTLQVYQSYKSLGLGKGFWILSGEAELSIMVQGSSSQPFATELHFVLRRSWQTARGTTDVCSSVPSERESF